MDKRAKMAAMRRKLRHAAEERSIEFRSLQAENARLRAALEEIVRALGTEPTAGDPGRPVRDAELLDTARRALDDDA